MRSIRTCACLALLASAGGASAGGGRQLPLPDPGASPAAGLSLVQEQEQAPEQGQAVNVDGPQQELYLEVILNQVVSGRLARFVIRDDVLYASAATLAELGLRWPGSATRQGLVALQELPGVEVAYDVAGQTIALQVPVAMLDRESRRVGFTQPERPLVDPASRVPGVLFNYDLYGQRSEDAGTLSGFSELRVFGVGRGVLSNTLSSRFRSGEAALLGQYDSVRLDTSWQLDLPERMISVVVGDAITGSLDWSRATRIGGIRVSRNFALQPYRINTPLASFAGEAALPSTVDLYIDGLRQSSQDVQPGRFQIDSVPSLNGAGQAQLVITDINGQSRLMGFSLYGTPDLLQAGLSDWSLEAGVVRREFGERSFSYAGDPVFSATGRYGWSDALTLEGHAEGSDEVQQAGMGTVWLLGQRGGVLSASLAGSRSKGLDGNQHGLGYQWASRMFSASLNTLRRSDGFRDLASLEGATLPRRTDQAFAGVSSPLGQWGVSYVAQTYVESGRSRFASLNWSRLVAGRSTLSVSVNRSLDIRNGDSAFVFWSLPLDRLTSLSTAGRHTRSSQSLTVEANRAISGDLGGWGWRAQATVGDTRSGLAQVSQLGRFGQWTAGVDRFEGGNGIDPLTTGFASVSGGLAWMQGHTYAMRRVDDAFALVSTSGVAGVPVRLENRLVGETDENGLLLINRLNAWQLNQISIDPLQLPADMQLGSTRLEAVPAGRSGTLARFALRRTLAVQLNLRLANGAWVPAGTPVFLQPVAAGDAASAATVVGHDGMVYLQDPPAGARLQAGSSAGACSVALPIQTQREGRVDLGELTCR